MPSNSKLTGFAALAAKYIADPSILTKKRQRKAIRKQVLAAKQTKVPAPSSEPTSQTSPIDTLYDASNGLVPVVAPPELDSSPTRLARIAEVAYTGDITSLPEPFLQARWFKCDKYSARLLRHERLHEEVSALAKFLSPSTEEILVRESLLKKVEYCCQELWPEASVHNFGSYKTNTYLPMSDLDLVVFIPNADQDVSAYLFAIQSKISSQMQLSFSAVRPSAKVPILNLTEALSGLSLDICINVTSGIESSIIVSAYLEKYPVLRDLVLVIKFYLDLYNYNKPYKGGLSSYGVILLVVSYLQTSTFVRPNGTVPPCHLGMLFYEFFELYGTKFNCENEAISLSRERRIPRCEALALLGPTEDNKLPLILLDPQDESKNVARSCFNYHKIRRSMSHVFSNLDYFLSSYELCRLDGVACKSILNLTIGFSDTLYAERDRLVRVARGQLSEVSSQ